MFTTLTMTQLIDLRDQYVKGIMKLAANQSWTLDGTTYSRASLADVKDVLRDVEAEINRRGGTAGGVAPSGRNVRYLEI